MQPAIAQTAGPSAQPSTSMPDTSDAEVSQAAAATSMVPASQQASTQGEVRQGQRQGQGSALSDQAAALSLPDVARGFSRQDKDQSDNRLAQAQIPPALHFGPSTSATAVEVPATESGVQSAAVDAGSSQQVRQEQTGAAASHRQVSLRGLEDSRSLLPSTEAGPEPSQDSSSHCAEQGAAIALSFGEFELMLQCVFGLSRSSCMILCSHLCVCRNYATGNTPAGGGVENPGQPAAVVARPSQTADSISRGQRALTSKPPSASWSDIKL